MAGRSMDHTQEVLVENKENSSLSTENICGFASPQSATSIQDWFSGSWLYDLFSMT